MDNTTVMAETNEIVQAREMGSSTIARATELARAITDGKTLGLAADFLLEIKRRRKQWAEFNKPAKQKLDVLKKELLERERQIDEPMERAENQILKPAMIQFEQAQEQKRRQAEDKLREEARRREEDIKLRAAQEAKDQGEAELADAILEEEIRVPAVVVPRADTPNGISYREVWRFRVTNESLVPREYLVIDDKKIGAVVRALKKETRIDGIEVWAEKTIAGRV